jgi:ubiquinone/menaquinone biosynthesis C-methylase UbiE
MLLDLHHVPEVAMAKTWNTSGPDWGVGHYESTAERLRPAARVLVDAAGLAPGQQVLDVGSGTGNVALLAAEAGAAVTAVDPSPRLLAVAAAAAQDRGLPLECRLGDAAAVPAQDRSFDRVLSSFGIIFAPNPEAAAGEVARVLRPHGMALLTAWLPGGGVGALAVACQEMVREALGAPAADPGLPWHDVGAVGSLFAQHRLVVTEVARHALPFTAPSPRSYLDAELTNHPMAVAGFQVLEKAGQAEAARQKLLQLLEEHNESAESFRSTSHYVVLRVEAP